MGYRNMINPTERRFSIPGDPEKEKSANQALRAKELQTLVEDAYQKEVARPEQEGIHGASMEAIANDLADLLESQYSSDIDGVIAQLESQVEFKAEKRELVEKVTARLRESQEKRNMPRQEAA